MQTSLLQRLSNHSTKLDDKDEYIRKNIESILNSRLRYITLPSELKEIKYSLISYGLSDFMNANMTNEITQNHFCENIKFLLKCFEPRILVTHASIQPIADDKFRTLKLYIEAKLGTNKDEKFATFESILNLNQAHFQFN